LVVVIASRIDGNKCAPTIWLAKILRAGIVVFAGQCGAGSAEAGIALVTDRTEVAVIAGSSIGEVGAASHGRTEIVGARIVITAIYQTRAHARAARADVGRGTGVKVVARCRVVGVDAAHQGIAEVIGAGVAVVTIEGTAGLAASSAALIAESAEVTVVAR